MATDRKQNRTKYPGVTYRQEGGERRYYVTYRDANGKQRRERVHGDITAAREFLGQRHAEIKQEKQERQSRVQRGLPSEDRTFAQVADEYMEGREFATLAPGTQKVYTRSLRNYVLPTFGERPVRTIDTDAVGVWLEELRELPRQRRRGDRTRGLSESGVNGALTALRVVFKFAAGRKRGYVTANPIDGLDDHERPKVETDRQPVQVLDESQLARLFAAAPYPYNLMFKLKAWTGLRSSELRAILPGEPDLERGELPVSRQIDDEDRGERVAIKARTLTDHREVPLTVELVEELRDHLARRAEFDIDSRFLFAHDGGHITHARLDSQFRAAVEAAGIEREAGKRLTPHALRHSFGSNLLNMGEELVDVSRWLGHKQLSTTQRIYFHEVRALSDAAAQRMRERMESRRRVNSPVNTEGHPGAPAESFTVPESLS